MCSENEEKSKKLTLCRDTGAVKSPAMGGVVVRIRKRRKVIKEEKPTERQFDIVAPQPEEDIVPDVVDVQEQECDVVDEYKADTSIEDNESKEEEKDSGGDNNKDGVDSYIKIAEQQVAAEKKEKRKRGSKLDTYDSEINKKTKKFSVIKSKTEDEDHLLSEDQMSERTRVRQLLAANLSSRNAKRASYSGKMRRDKVIRDVVISNVITVQELANRMAERGKSVINMLKSMDYTVKLDDEIAQDIAELVVVEFGHRPKLVSDSDVEGILYSDEDQEEFLPRPPVVTIVGHVDHGKTSLLDRIRHSNITHGEFGGITQHIGAYQIATKSGKPITFIDTPGHAAFTAMRQRGVRVTDIVLLVVAANDGIKEQTIEAINHAKAADVVVIVVISKIDLPDANVERIINDLLRYEIIVEAMGGDVMVCEVSAKQGTGINELNEAIALQAEIMELRANPKKLACGVVIESRLDKRRGIVVSLLVQGGTLRVGDLLVSGVSSGKIRSMVDDYGESIKVAGPSMPVQVMGFDSTPDAGEKFHVLESEKDMMRIINHRLRVQEGGDEEFDFDQSESKALKVVIKGDVHGSVEAIKSAITKFTNDEVSVDVLHSGVGAIVESDVLLASVTNSMIIGFNVRAHAKINDMIDAKGVKVYYYDIIYDLIDNIKSMVTDMLAPNIKEKALGTAEIRKVFSLERYGKIAGCYVTNGIIKRDAHVRLLRDSIVVYKGKIRALKRFKDDVKEVNFSFECGMSFENYDDIKVGDAIESFELIEERAVL